MSHIIVGLGNPGKAYEGTRHNIGSCIVRAFGAQRGWPFVQSKVFQGATARGVVGKQEVILLMPHTYMNSSGYSVQAMAAQCEVPLSQICVVCDDIYLPLGRVRMRAYGGSGGHNGLKSIDAHVGTHRYPRLRVGIGDRQEGDLADHVLSRFLAAEVKQLPQIIEWACHVLELWIEKGITEAMRQGNTPPKQKELEEKLGE